MDWPEAHTKLMVHQDAVENVIGSLRAKIAQQNYIIGKCKFLLNSQILNWTINVCFREELPLGSLGSSFTKVSDRMGLVPATQEEASANNFA
jgi:hypothetical protein